MARAISNTIPLTHPDWFASIPNKIEELGRRDKSVAELIDDTNRKWRPKLVRKLYQSPIGEEILNPLAGTGGGQDKMILNFSRSSEFQVKKTYAILLQHTVYDGSPST